MNATLKIPILSEEQLKHIRKAEKELLELDIYFDTGYDLVKNIRDWELDWSLEGAKLTDRMELVFDSQNIKTSKYIMNAEDELRQAEVYFDSRFNIEDRIVWELNELQGAELVIRKPREESTEGVKEIRPNLKKPMKVPRWVAKRRWVNLNNPLTRKRLGLKKKNERRNS